MFFFFLFFCHFFDIRSHYGLLLVCALSFRFLTRKYHLVFGFNARTDGFIAPAFFAPTIVTSFFYHLRPSFHSFEVAEEFTSIPFSLFLFSLFFFFMPLVFFLG